MKISVVIPTLNEEYYIGRLLKRLKKQTSYPFEIIVVDGKSDDKTKKEVRKSKDVILLQTEKDVSKQRNLGAKMAKGEIIIFLDADTLPKRDFIEKLSTKFLRSNYDYSCCFYSPNKKNIFIHLIYEFFNVIFFIFQKILPSGAGMCIIVKKDVFSKSGGFRENIKYEDMELIKRLVKENRFGVIPIRLGVSDRRFRKYGIFNMLVKYLVLSLLFSINRFDVAERVNYPFGEYDKTK